MDRIKIPVDIHIARATLAMGVITGKETMRFDQFKGSVAQVWFDSVKNVTVKSRPMIALDVDEPLWHLSKFGCTNRDKASGFCTEHGSCVVKDYCVNGMVNVSSSFVEFSTC